MKRTFALGAALCLVVFDQVTKRVADQHLSGLPGDHAVRVIRNVLYLRPITNRGGIWGILGDLPSWVFLVVSVAVITYLILLIWRLDKREYGYLPCLALFLGGFIGNGIDRFRFGYVTDFIYFIGYPPWLISTFNVADIAILIGMVWLLGRFLKVSWSRKQEALS